MAGRGRHGGAVARLHDLGRGLGQLGHGRSRRQLAAVDDAAQLVVGGRGRHQGARRRRRTCDEPSESCHERREYTARSRIKQLPAPCGGRSLILIAAATSRPGPHSPKEVIRINPYEIMLHDRARRSLKSDRARSSTASRRPSTKAKAARGARSSHGASASWPTRSSTRPRPGTTCSRSTAPRDAGRGHPRARDHRRRDAHHGREPHPGQHHRRAGRRRQPAWRQPPEPIRPLARLPYRTHVRKWRHRRNTVAKHQSRHPDRQPDRRSRALEPAQRHLGVPAAHGRQPPLQGQLHR